LCFWGGDYDGEGSGFRGSGVAGWQSVAPQNGYAGNRTTGKFSAHLQLVRHVACRKIINTLIELLTDTHTVASKGGYRPRANAVHRSWVSRQEGGFWGRASPLS